MKCKYLYLQFLLFILIVTISCSDEEKQLDFRVSTGEISFPEEGGVGSFHIRSNYRWKLQKKVDWINLTPEKGPAGHTEKIEVIVSFNHLNEKRMSKITVTSNGVDKEISIIQNSQKFLEIPTTDFSLSNEEQELLVLLKSSSTPTIVSLVDWIIPTKSVNEDTQSFLIQANKTEESREGKIEFSIANEKKVVKIKQEATINIMKLNALELAKKIHLGWNLGNSLESNGGEIAWGNPITSFEHIKMIKDNGFNAVRIPCNWCNGYISNDGTYTIKKTWLKRVKEVVDYCVDQNLYTILNIHYDGGWLETNCTPDKQEEVNRIQKKIWEQIATYFKEYGELLLFAGCNEPNAKKEDEIKVLEIYEQTFVDAVRSSGGNNLRRNLIIQVPNTDIDYVDKLKIPVDKVTNRLMMEVHYYSPWQFCGLEKDESWGTMFYFWGKDNYVVDSDRNATHSEEDYVIDKFNKVKSVYVDQGVPVILGEYSVVHRSLSDDFFQQKHDASRYYFMKYVTEQAKKHGLVPFVWDHGSLNNNNMTIFDRENLKVYDEGQLKAVQEGAKASYPY